ncbi:putative bifunctional diguanylate cyclase/phosphodiesterase [Acidicapsa acidisoli]|uniref:putative bifunctional diguanylate cyclase/phosphodiesterase n=1 Tax=Acidicapsa acidisoli TaxID=1615681 RepID=UPI0021E02F2B|nr:EAL domain-containing protein [Acidicapsa acidisoli]
MKSRAIRFLPVDLQGIALIAAMIVLLVLGAVKLSNVVAANMLRADAQSTSGSGAAAIERSTDIPALIAGATPSEETKNLLEDASQDGDIYRLLIWSSSGRVVFVSGRKSPASEQANIPEVRKERVAGAVASGKAYTEAYAGHPPASPTYFADSYIPIMRNGSVVGVFEVYLDQTADKALYERSLLLTESIIAIAVLFAGGIPGFMVYRMMMARRVAQAEALFLAENDNLTRIPNRKGLEEAAARALSLTRRNKTHVAALFLDLDRFKDINDSFGHAAGDEVLRALAKRLESVIRKEDMAARLGGDEFVILQVGIDQPAGASSLAERLKRILSEPYDIGGYEVVCGASIGVAIAPTDAETWDSLLSCADVALYKAKAEGRNTVRFFEAGMDAAFRERRRLEADLRRALETKAFRMEYQPLVSFRDGNLLGFEALLRWPEDWKPQPPAVFIPVAEESGLIVPIGALVLETACRTAAAWTKPLKIAVNLSPVQFRHGDIVAVVQEALHVSGLDPARLELEVTESLWLQNTDVVLDQLARLRGMGISIALDDFGTGYSSLTYLWKFPFDKVKIDRSFVTEMEIDLKASAIVSTIVALGRTLDLTVTAEGVETQAQANALCEAGCDQAQGYLFGRPLSLKAANELVNADRASSTGPPCSCFPSPINFKPTSA